MSDALIGGALLGAGSVRLAGEGTAGAGPGGGIVTVESTDGSVTVTNPSGPVVDLSVPAGAGNLAAVYAAGLGTAPPNTLAMPNGNLVFRSTPAGGGFTLGALGFFESQPLLSMDGRVSTFINRRTQRPGEQGTQFGPTNTVFNAGYVGNLIDGTEWGGPLGLLTSDPNEAQQVGDPFWSQKWYGASFFFNQPLSLPDAGGGQSAAVVYLFDNLFAGFNSNRINQARSLSGFGQESVFPRGQRNGITPGFLSVWTGADIPGPYLAGDGTGIWLAFGDPSHLNNGSPRGIFEAHMLNGDPALPWGVGIWAWDNIVGPYQIAELDQGVGLKLFRGGYQFPNCDAITFPISEPLTARVIWDDVSSFKRFMVSIDAQPYSQWLATSDDSEQFLSTEVLDLLTPGPVSFGPVPMVRTGFVFIATQVSLMLYGHVGAAATDLTYSIGNDGGNQNVVPLRTVTAAAINGAAVPGVVDLAAAPVPGGPFVDAGTEIKVNVVSSPTGLTALTGRVLLSGTWFSL